MPFYGLVGRIAPKYSTANIVFIDAGSGWTRWILTQKA
jgi:hypothetical protein